LTSQPHANHGQDPCAEKCPEHCYPTPLNCLQEACSAGLEAESCVTCANDHGCGQCRECHVEQHVNSGGNPEQQHGNQGACSSVEECNQDCGGQPCACCNEGRSHCDSNPEGCGGNHQGNQNDNGLGEKVQTLENEQRVINDRLNSMDNKINWIVDAIQGAGHTFSHLQEQMNSGGGQQHGPPVCNSIEECKEMNGGEPMMCGATEECACCNGHMCSDKAEECESANTPSGMGQIVEAFKHPPSPPKSLKVAPEPGTHR
jgi:hypothetical protein